MSTLIFSSIPCPTTFHRQASHNTIVCSTPSPPNVLFHSCDVKYAKCKAFYKASNKDGADVVHETDMPFGNKQHAIKKYVKEIASVFDLMEDGEITSSPYDTAWVALIKDINRPNSGPHFPECLNWIVNNQLDDGSWGESLMFSAHDRLINTLACVVALTSWNVYPDKCQKGTEFVNENMKRLKDEDYEHMMIGFEIVFPVLIQLARKLDINVSADASILDEIYSKQAQKLSKIPMDKLHETPTSLLHSLEGMEDLDWEKLLKLQCENGSFFFSPAATAFAFMQTKDHKCLEYLTNLVAKFKGGVPNVYPVDMFEHIWIVDRLQRLGIARHFQSEIKGCVDYVHRYWNKQGIGFARNTNVPDIDDTAMGFRVLRTNGYQISPDVFRHFEKDGKFAAFPDNQMTEAVTGMYNLYRASQVLFPGEKILEDAKNFSHKFLTEKRSTNELLDKWIIAKDLPGEVGYALDVPWYASLPRLEARYYLEQYGGDDDIWIGKSLYRMGYVNNNKYLYMAKLDYNHCQSIHQLEYNQIQKWYAKLNIEKSSSTRLLWSYYEAAANIFEPKRCNERIAWAKTTMLLNTVTSFFARSTFSNDDKQAFVDAFTNTQHHENEKPWHAVMDTLLETLQQISSDTLATHGVDIHAHLHSAWTSWLLSWQKEANMAQGEGELIVRTIYMSSGRLLTEEPLPHPLNRLFSLTNDLYHRTIHKGNNTKSLEVELKMQELVQLVLNNFQPNNLGPDLKWTCLVVAKALYYKAHFDAETINHHINKVLFEKVI